MKQNIWMRSLCVVLVMTTIMLALPVTASAIRFNNGRFGNIGGYQINLIFETPAREGENPFHIQILDNMGKPVSMAQVDIVAMPVENSLQHEQNMQKDVPAMGGMQDMQLAATPTEAVGMSAMDNMGGSPAESPTEASGMDGMGINPAETIPPSTGMPGMSGMKSALTPTAPSIDSMPGMDAVHSPAAEQESTAIPAAAENVTGSGKTMSGLNAETIQVKLASGEKAGEYNGSITFPSAGHWMLTAHIQTNGQTLDVDFPVDVAASSAGRVILAGFAGFNLILISIAAIIRRKPVTA